MNTIQHKNMSSIEWEFFWYLNFPKQIPRLSKKYFRVNFSLDLLSFQCLRLQRSHMYICRKKRQKQRMKKQSTGLLFELKTFWILTQKQFCHQFSCSNRSKMNWRHKNKTKSHLNHVEKCSTFKSLNI